MFPGVYLHCDWLLLLLCIGIRLSSIEILILIRHDVGKIRCCTHLTHSVEEIGFCIIAIVLLPRDLRLHNGAYTKNTVILLSEHTTLFVDGVHHVLVSFEGFIRFTCRKECLAPFLVSSETQRLEIPAEELDKAL
ncbi:hypothetical protein DFJ58DRAFT_835023, partial [Suillus subalutaceus]|uniref:uncharacterized protein n=1 Tax=Suillus subalutaceus TaxID=48586 RepID=UPI001B87469F